MLIWIFQEFRCHLLSQTAKLDFCQHMKLTRILLEFLVIKKLIRKLMTTEFCCEFFRNFAAICFHRQQNLISVNIWNSLEFFLNSWWLRKLMTTESFKNSAATCFSYEMSLDFFMIFWMFEKAYDNGILPRILMRKLEGFSFLAICTKLQKNFQIWNVFKVID